MEVGDPYRFVPAAFGEVKDDYAASFQIPVRVTGWIERIYLEHRWFRVAYRVNGSLQHECFPLPAETPIPDPGQRDAYKRAFDGGVREMTQAYRKT